MERLLLTAPRSRRQITWQAPGWARRQGAGTLAGAFTTDSVGMSGQRVRKLMIGQFESFQWAVPRMLRAGTGAMSVRSWGLRLGWVAPEWVVYCL